MKLRHLTALAVMTLSAALSPAQQNRNSLCVCEIPNGPPNQHPYLVGYLGVYKPMDWVSYAKTLDFTKMTGDVVKSMRACPMTLREP